MSEESTFSFTESSFLWFIYGAVISASRSIISDDLEGSGRGLTEVQSRHLPGETEKHHKKPARITSVPTEIRFEDLQNSDIPTGDWE
jgi:hypothetical protein